jgi:asparagine synthase (glutamine-hydrolysing)
MVADVPIGSFLSGGVDSTTITALMARKSMSKIKTFSIGFESGSDYSNELSEARIAADFIKTDHTEIILNDNDIISNFDEFITALDQPSIDGLNTFFVSKACKGELKVAFSGLGADEIFAGYSHFGWPSKYKSNNFKLLNTIGASLYAYFPRNIFFNSYLASLSSRERLEGLRRQFSNSLIGQVVNHDLMSSFSSNYMNVYLNSMNLGTEDSVNTHSQYEIQHYLLNTLLRDTDAVSMGNSSEVRPPFLDHKLVEFALSLPESIKWGKGVGKYVLKEAAKELLPKDFFSRKK